MWTQNSEAIGKAKGTIYMATVGGGENAVCRRDIFEEHCEEHDEDDHTNRFYAMLKIKKITVNMAAEI